MARINPFTAAARGIERFTPVYGVVPLNADGSIMREHGQHAGVFPEWPEDYTTWATRKGIVAGDSRTEREVIEKVKVSWQATALGRSAISRATVRWPQTFKIFSPEEIKGIIKGQELLIGTGTDYVSGPLNVDPEEIPDQVDQLIEHPVGNFLLTGVLNRAIQQRWQRCWE